MSHIKQRLMREHQFSPPTFESNRSDNFFVSRFLLHHFLSNRDIKWLSGIASNLSEAQKFALIFIREQGAIDNSTLRQLTDCDTLAASQELRKLRDQNLIEKKGQSTATYYIPGSFFPRPDSSDLPPSGHVTLGGEHVTLGGEHVTLAPEHGTLDPDIPSDLYTELQKLGKRPGKEKLRPLILELCKIKPWTAEDLARALGNRNSRSLKADHLSKMIAGKQLRYLYQDMEKHPNQAYLTNT